MSEIESFDNRKISVIGAGRSGIAAAAALQRRGAAVLLSDSKPAEKAGEAFAEAQAGGVPFLFGAGVAEALPPGTERVVTSPGVPKDSAVLREALARRIPIWGEVELAYRLSPAPIIGITGTNGKTTTTLLTAAMLQEAKRDGHIHGDTIVCGNISADEIKKTLVQAAEEANAADILVAEISSFQLEWVEKFAPRAAILTNITPDHLNRHHSFEEYVQAKARIFAAQSETDWAIIGWDNPASRAVGESRLPSRRIWFTTGSALPDGSPCAYLEQGMLTLKPDADAPALSLLHVSELSQALPGEHSVANALASATAALALGASPEAIVTALKSFRGAAHRMEWVADVRHVRYINNSMCTNVAAAIASLRSMDRPTIVIAGGADKDLEFEPLTPTLCEKAKQVILIGSAADKMERAFRAGGYPFITRAESLEAAFDRAASQAEEGDAVLLSPACASFDMFRDFEERGAAFRALVRSLQERDS